MNKLVLATACAAAAAITASPVMASPIACANAPVSTYTATGFSCSVDGGAIVFSDFIVNTALSGSGGVGLGNIAPVNTVPGEFGLQLNYLANTGSTGGGADVAWSFQVTAPAGLIDAYANLTGSVSGDATSTLQENLFDINGNQIISTPMSGNNNIFISLGNTPNSETVTFAPETFLSVTKDQQDFAASGASSSSSIVQDEFSLTPIPGTLPLLAGGLIGLFALRRKRKKGQAGGRLESALA